MAKTRRIAQPAASGETTAEAEVTVPLSDWTAVEGEKPARAVRGVTPQLLSLAQALQDGVKRVVRATPERDEEAEVLRRLLGQAGYRLKIVPTVRPDPGDGSLVEVLEIRAVRRPTEEEAAAAKVERERKAAERKAAKDAAAQAAIEEARNRLNEGEQQYQEAS